MPEVNFSMANLNLAVEIKPADIKPAEPSPGCETSRSYRQESFRSVLSRSERGSEATREGVNRDTQSGSPTERIKNPQTGKPESPEKPVDGGQTDVAGGPASVPTTSDGSQQTTGDSTVESSSPVSNAVTEAGSVAAQTARTATDGLTLGMLIDELAGAGQDTGPGSARGSGSGLNPAVLEPVPDPSGDLSRLIQPGQAGRAVDLPTTGTSGSAADALSRQFLDISNGNADSAARDVPINAFRDTVPQTGNGQSTRSEWTNTLELTRLLNPTIERGPVGQSRAAEAPKFDPQVRQPVNRDAPEVPRNTGPPRFTEPVTEGTTGKSVDPNLWRLNAEAEVVYGQSSARSSIAQSEVVYRPPFEVSQMNSPTGGSTTGIQGARQAQPVTPIEGVGSQLRIDPQALVSDVRQAVLRVAADGRGEARLTLHPPELGELVVRLESARNGVVRAEFHTISPLVREALEAGISKLIEALEAEGLTLAQADVHLNLQLGAEGSSGESDNSTAGNSPTIGTFVDNEGIASGPVVEWLPEGATISILA